VLLNPTDLTRSNQCHAALGIQQGGQVMGIEPVSPGTNDYEINAIGSCKVRGHHGRGPSLSSPHNDHVASV